MSSSKSVLPDNDTVEQVFNALETETAALFEQLDLSFLIDHPVFGPLESGANTGPSAARTAEGRPTLLLQRYLRSAADGARTPERRCLAAVWL